MDSHTLQHKELENAEIRKHVVDIVSQLGLCIFGVLNPSTDIAPRKQWEDLGHRICDFGEYLDGDDDASIS